MLILGLFGGLIADALPKRPTLITTQAIQMMLAFVLFGLSVTDTVQVWHILVLATILGITNAVDMPTRQAFTVEMVGREDVPNAIALNSAIFNGARIVGPAIAGLTIGLFGGNVSPAFLINGLSFFAVILAYLAMRQDELHHVAARTPGRARSREVGLDARGRPALRPPQRHGPARDRHGRAGVHVRHELRRDHPGARAGRPRRRTRPGTASS